MTQPDADRDARRDAVRRLRDARVSGHEIARQLGISEATVRRDLKALAQDGAPKASPLPPAMTHSDARDAAHDAPATDARTLVNAARDTLRAIHPDALRHDHDAAHATRHPLRTCISLAIALLAQSDPLDNDDRDALRQLADRLNHQANRRPS
ncbi:HTH domain-containing protein [Streptomyces sp. NPDC051940]|uniref:HTH domain-containing protein n=1 Tax=Streptomyces sp. NPDC051940 TaxID=3155675 RepID=UPI003436EDE3